jgi:cyanate lyase
MIMPFTEIVAQQLYEKRMTVAELARRMGYCDQYVRMLLRGQKRWNETTMTKAASILDIEIIYHPMADQESTRTTQAG